MTGLTKMCSFAQNIGLLLLIAILLTNLPYSVKVWRQSDQNWLIYIWQVWIEMCSFAWNIGLFPLIAIVSKNYPSLWILGDNPLTIDWDVYDGFE